MGFRKPLPLKTFRRLARGVPSGKSRGRMNGLETAYAAELRARQGRGEIDWWRYEAYTLRLADGAKFCPDFAVLLADGILEFHEVKGFWREAARVRIKVAAEVFPHPFLAVTRSRAGVWEFERFGEEKTGIRD